MIRNGVMMQFFEWNLPNSGNLWNRIRREALHLHQMGITALWIPPAYKAISQKDEGYGTYDLYDLGEFNQKGTIRTKYGTKKELKRMIDQLHKHHICIYLDAVMNHKAGSDHSEVFSVREVDPNQRNQYISNTFEIEGMTGFDFPGRNNQYSDFKWHWHHFSGVDYDKKTGKKGIYQIIGDGKSWNQGVDDENGNYDYLMFADLDFDNPEVINEINKWGVWVSNELNLDGMRLDAIKHISDHFIKQFLETIRKEYKDDFYAVGEYWKRDINALSMYLENVGYSVDLFDVPLHYNLFEASKNGKNYNLCYLLKDTLVEKHPNYAVTFVDNHDSQKGSSLESEIEDWFKPSAYALILLMKDGYPCIFYGDYYGIKRKNSRHRTIINILTQVRCRYAHGEQINYFDHPNTVGFIRMGDEKHPRSGLALLISNGEDGVKNMHAGVNRAGETWYDITGNSPQKVTIDKDGNADFYVKGCTFSAWIKE